MRAIPALDVLAEHSTKDSSRMWSSCTTILQIKGAPLIEINQLYKEEVWESIGDNLCWAQS